ncbi:MAG: D-alanyl-D-alanine carboxypeptidase [Firmicutes bacterium]|nr:D-alanyl-D-alanine carboxypeptidase [Bacillota bacterium]
MIKRASFRTNFMLLLFFFLFSFTVGAETTLPEISAEAAILFDWNSGRILYAKNPYLARPVASTTKIMTAVIALEKGKLNDKIITSPRAANTGGSSIWLEEGEVKNMEELLLGLMLRSGNDAAVAIAEHISGSVEDFAALMTQRAAELGALNTSFCNPHGLHHPEHYSTPYDMALISAHAMGIKEFRRIVSTASAVISWPEQPWDRVLYNQNKLLTSYEGAEGIKTGWTTPAGRCFVGAAARDGRRLISVVLNAPRMWEDTQILLDYGFVEFQHKCFLKKGQHLKSVAVENGMEDKVKIIASQSFGFPLKIPKNNEGSEDNKITYRFVINEPLQAPLKTGEKVGELEISFCKDVVGRIDLLAGHEVRKISFWEKLKRTFGRRE